MFPAVRTVSTTGKTTFYSQAATTPLRTSIIRPVDQWGSSTVSRKPRDAKIVSVCSPVFGFSSVHLKTTRLLIRNLTRVSLMRT